MTSTEGTLLSEHYTHNVTVGPYFRFSGKYNFGSFS